MSMRLMRNVLALTLFGLLAGCVSASGVESVPPVAKIQLANGDALTAKLKSVHKDKVYLKHEIMGDLEFEWKELAEIVTDEDVRVVLKNGDRLTGRLVKVQPGKFRLEGSEVSTEEISLSEIVSVNEPEREITWRGEALLSYTRTAGNKRTADTAFLFRGVRETERDAVLFKGNYNYGTTDDDLSKRSSAGLLKYSYKVSKRLYTYLATGAAMDYFKKLELRSDMGAGCGWKAVDGKPLQLSFELGLSYTNEDYREPVPPEPDSDVNYGGVRSAMEGELSLSEGVTFYLLIEFNTPFDHAKLWRYHSESVLSVDLSRKLSLKAGYVLDHDRRAAEGTKRTDGKTLVAIGYRF